MSKLAFLSSGTGVALGATAALGALALAGYVSGVFPEVSMQKPAPVEPAAQVAPEEDAAPEAPQVSALVTVPQKPTFDVVRVETGGEAMIAGSAQAGSTVAIRVDETIVAEVKADRSGKFASFVTLPQNETASVLTLDVQGGELGTEQVFVAPIAAPEVAAVQDAPVVEEEPPAQEASVAQPVEDAEDAGVQVAVVEAAPAREVQQPVQPEAQRAQRAQSEAQAPLVLLATEEGVRVMQAPDAPKPEAMTALLGSISYDTAGDVALSGRGDGEFVRVYLDNRPIATSQIAANGDWQAGLPAVDTGIYTLRVDELNEAGDVVARVETPFKREAAEVLEAVSQPEKPIQAITVQPGATLWAIARERYGSGTLYARVVEANADVIRDPDLIYPGQVFTVPD